MENSTEDRVKAFLERNKGMFSRLNSNYSHSKELLRFNSMTPTSSISADKRLASETYYERQNTSPLTYYEASSSPNSRKGTGDSLTITGRGNQSAPGYKSVHSPSVHDIQNMYPPSISIPKDSYADRAHMNREYNVKAFNDTVSSSIRTPQKNSTLRTEYSDGQNKEPSSPLLERRTVSSHSITPTNKIEAFLENQKRIQNKIKENAMKACSKHQKTRHASMHQQPEGLKLDRAETLTVTKGSSTYSSINPSRSVSPKPSRSSYGSRRAEMLDLFLSKEAKSPQRKKDTHKENRKKTYNKEESHQFAYEESSETSFVKKSNQPSPRKTTKSQISSTTTPKKKNPETSTRPSTGEKDVFPESSKKLNELNTALSDESKFKKEIRKLIETIKEEKAQVSQEIQKMSEELQRYKMAYKKLKKEKAAQQKATKAEEQESKVTKKKSPKKDIEENNLFTIEALNNYNSPIVKSNKLNKEEILSHVETLNKDIESIVNGVRIDLNSSLTNMYKGQLGKKPINMYIIKEMSLDPTVFFQEPNSIGTLTSAPSSDELLAAQRDIIKFLYEKLQFEQYQRLKTEEQTNQMVLSMDKTIKQLEDRRYASREKRREGSYVYDSNKGGQSPM